jgi:HTH-type transcriptional regulator/antitoxin HigA
LEEVTTTAEIIDENEYARLLSQALPHVIHTEAENDRCTAVLEALTFKNTKTDEEQRLSELLTLLIENFEERVYALPLSTPVDIIRHLMEANGLRQADMVEVFGTPSVVSEILNGKRSLSKTHIAKLAQRFHVSPELFFPPLVPAAH